MCLFSSLPPIDRRRLSDLNLPKENFLHLKTPEGMEVVANGEDGAEPKDEGSEDLRLIITNVTNNENYTLNFRRETVWQHAKFFRKMQWLLLQPHKRCSTSSWTSPP